ncbi:response regulator transcription factor [Streptomyces californicus]|uniref:response regulator transcription factor n=1 Tax=Streptomyces TaxID=1883 RepID=UPI00131960E9|nr:hypothetical protein GPZ77_02650 [Streptomyces sp. QHH-9511]
MDQLSTKESQVLALIATHRATKTSAQLLATSPLTVKTQVSRIQRKAGASSRAHLATIAHERGLVSPGPPTASIPCHAVFGLARWGVCSRRRHAARNRPSPTSVTSPVLISRRRCCAAVRRSTGST